MNKTSNQTLKLSENLMFLEVNDKLSICYNKSAFKPVLLPNTVRENYLNGLREINNPDENIVKMFTNNYIGFFDKELTKEEIYYKIIDILSKAFISECR